MRNRLEKLDPDARRLFEVRLARWIGARRPAAAPIVSRPWPPPWPVSRGQERILAFEEAHPATPTFLNPTVLAIAGECDHGALARAAGWLMERHLPLAVTFRREEGRRAMLPVAAPAAPLERVDLSGRAGAEAAARALLVERARQPFALDREPCLRLVLVRVAPDRHLLGFVCHHLAADGVSDRILLRDLAALYGAARGGGDPAAALPPLPVTFLDFVVWQRQWLAGPEAERFRSYWRSALAGAPARLPLPFDRTPAEPRTRGGASRSRALPAAAREAFERLARAERITPAILSLSLWALFVAGEIGGEGASRRDVVIGMTTGGRNRPELEDLIGDFTNVVPIRIGIDPLASFAALTRQVAERVREALDYQDLPYLDILEAARPGAPAEHDALYNVAFNASIESAAGEAGHTAGGARFEFAGTPDLGTSRFDLVGGVAASAGELRLGISVATDAFSATRHAELEGRYHTTIAAALAAPGAPVETHWGGLQRSGTPRRPPDSANSSSGA